MFNRELLKEAMKALEPFSQMETYEGDHDSERGSFSARIGDLRQARTTYDKLKSALEE